jgi:putative transposase
MSQKQLLIESGSELSIRRQCELLGISRTSYYYTPVGESPKNLALMRAIDELYLSYPFFGARRILAHLPEEYKAVNIKRLRRLMRLMGIEAIYCKPNLSKISLGHKVYPYLLKGKKITEPNQVWSTDITYIPMEKGFLYLVAVIDWYARFILSWRLSNSLHLHFCVECLEDALKNWGTPQIFNTDQGSQFTSNEFTSILENKGIEISMDSKGRALDNIFIERFWRSLKYECIYLHSWADGKQLNKGLKDYIYFYNCLRKHQSLNYLTPQQVYCKTS